MPDLEELLIRTSRTFALSIPLLPEPTRREVTIAYLLFRLADTFEDATAWDRADRIAALERFSRLLGQPGARPEPAEVDQAARRWYEEVPGSHPGYRELLEEVPFVLDSFFALQPEAIAAIRTHTRRTIAGMAGYVARTSDAGELALRDLADLRDYCYVVAGIVGELLTELFLLGRPELAPSAAALRRTSAPFGEGLQLVNILKDSAVDAVEGRLYLPAGVERAEVLALARRDLQSAAQYVAELQEGGAPRGVVAFSALPVHLALANLDHLAAAGPGAKLSRREVFAIVQHVHATLDRAEPAMTPPPPLQPLDTERQPLSALR